MKYIYNFFYRVFFYLIKEKIEKSKKFIEYFHVTKKKQTNKHKYTCYVKFSLRFHSKILS